MDWILLIGLVAASGLLLLAMMTLLRFERPRRIPMWIPLVGILVSATLLVPTVFVGELLTSVGLVLNLLVFSMLLGMSRRRIP
jgi:hypothetical protein